MSSPFSPLQRDPGTALHRQLFMVLRGQILQGTYARGSAIPPEDVLGAQFGVSRITVRRAVADLEVAGMVEKRRGLGTFVAQKAAVAPPHPKLGFIASLNKTAVETDVQVIQVESATAPPAIRMQLELDESAAAVHAVRLRSRRGVPVLLTEAWIPARFERIVTAAALKKKALFEILMANGVKFGRVIQEVNAVAAEPRTAQLLRTEVGAPLLRITRLMYDNKKSPVEYIRIYSSPDRSRLLMDFSASAVNTAGTGQLLHEVD